MAQTIDSSDLGQDSNNTQNQTSAAGQGTSSSSGSNTSQAGVAPTTTTNGASGVGSTSAPHASGPSGSSGGSQQQTIGSYNPNSQQGSGYTNIQKLVGANQNNQLGSTISGDINKSSNSVQDNLNNAQSQFNGQSTANNANTAANTSLVQNVLSNPTDYYSNGNTTNQTGANQFQSLMSGVYQGPTQLNNAAQLNAQAADVSQQGKNTQSQAGIQQLLQRYVGNGQYQQGQQNLDATLLGQTGSNQLAQARQGSLALQNNVNNATNAASAQGQQYTQQAKDYGQNVQNQFSQDVTNLNSANQQTAQAAQNAQNAQYQKALSDYASGKISQQEADTLGINNGQLTYNISANPYLQQNTITANAQNSASAQDYAKYAALQNLAGSYSPQAASNILNQYAGKSGEANSFQNEAVYGGDKTGYQNAVTQDQNDYNAQSIPAQQQVASDQIINNWATGNLSPTDISALQGMGYTNEWIGANASHAGQLLWQNYLQQSGAGNNSNNLSTSWAAQNLGNANSNYQNIMNALAQTYGTNTYNIQGQPLLNQNGTKIGAVMGGQQVPDET